ncbi:hypothetical protein GCM10009605_46470 [Nocardiopsis composta]
MNLPLHHPGRPPGTGGPAPRRGRAETLGLRGPAGREGGITGHGAAGPGRAGSRPPVPGAGRVRRGARYAGTRPAPGGAAPRTAERTPGPLRGRTRPIPGPDGRDDLGGAR